MKLRLANIFPLLCIALVVSSCNYNGGSNNNRPIKLGDSATIVTESDSQNLKDFVTDLKPVTPTETKPDTAPQLAAQPTTQPATQIVAQQPAKPTPPAAKPKGDNDEPIGNGLNVAFKEVAVSVPNIVTKSARNQNPQRSNGATYQLTSGNLNGNQIKVAGGSATVSQRYGTMVVVKNELGTLPLDNLATTTQWQPLKGRNNVYTISGLAPSQLTYPKASPGAIRNAVIKAARRQRMSRRKEQDWVNSIRNVRTANQRPLTTVLRSVEWKIVGKAANGKPYQKQLRIDIP